MYKPDILKAAVSHHPFRSTPPFFQEKIGQVGRVETIAGRVLTGEGSEIPDEMGLVEIACQVRELHPGQGTLLQQFENMIEADDPGIDLGRHSNVLFEKTLQLSFGYKNSVANLLHSPASLRFADINE